MPQKSTSRSCAMMSVIVRPTAAARSDFDGRGGTGSVTGVTHAPVEIHSLTRVNSHERITDATGEEQPMANRRTILVAAGLAVGTVAVLAAAQGGQAQQAAQAPAEPDAIRMLVGRLELEKYKATIKGLTQFGDRREGTQRNRDAVAWIEAQLKSYGCPTERLMYDPQNPRGLTAEQQPAGRGAGGGGARGGGGGGGGAARGGGGGGRATEPPRVPAGTPD